MNVIKLTKVMMILLCCSVVADVQAQLRPDGAEGQAVKRMPGDAKSHVKTSQAPEVCKECSSNKTPLHWVAYKGHADCVQALIDARAHVNFKNKWDETPLHVAARNGHADCVRALITAGADVSIRNKWDETPLHCAVYKGYADCVCALIDAGADVNIQDKWCFTALHSAACRSRSAEDGRLWGFKNCIKLLLSAGAVRDLGPVTDALNQGWVAERAQEQAIVDECARELQAYIMKRQQDVLNRMRTVPELEYFPRELLSLIVSFEGFSIDPEPSTVRPMPNV